MRKFQTACEIVQNFDSVLLEKANKVTVQEELFEIKKVLKTKLTEFEGKMTQSETLVKEACQQAKQVKKELTDQVYQAVKTVFSQAKKPDWDLQQTQFSEVLNLKVDKADL